MACSENLYETEATPTAKERIEMIKSMKKAGLASVLTAALVLGGTAGAFAVEGGAVATIPTVSATPTATPAPALGGPHKRAVAAYRVSNTEFKSKMTAFKAERITYKTAVDAYRVIEKAYRAARGKIAATYKGTIAIATSAYDLIANDAASTSAQKLAAETELKSVRATATTARDNAITALGAAPVAPAKPMPPMKPVRPTKAPKPAPTSTPEAAPVVAPAPTAPTV